MHSEEGKLKEGKIDVVIENPWKRVVIVGIIIIAFVIITEVVSKFFENLLPKIYANPYFVFAAIIPAVILIAVLLFIFLKRKKKLGNINNKKSSPA